MTRIEPVCILLMSALLWGCSVELSESSEAVALPEPTSDAAVNTATAVVEDPRIDERLPSKLDLSRGALEEFSSATGQMLGDAEPTLPDMFEKGKDSRRLSASGRVLTDAEAGVTLDAIEGVEMRIELKTN